MISNLFTYVDHGVVQQAGQEDAPLLHWESPHQCSVTVLQYMQRHRIKSKSQGYSQFKSWGIIWVSRCQTKRRIDFKLYPRCSHERNTHRGLSIEFYQHDSIWFDSTPSYLIAFYSILSPCLGPRGWPLTAPAPRPRLWSLSLKKATMHFCHSEQKL